MQNRVVLCLIIMALLGMVGIVWYDEIYRKKI